MQLKLRTLFLLVLLGGTLLGFSFPFTGGSFILSFVAIVPLLIINFQLNKLKKRRFWKRFFLNYIYFLLYNFIVSWWIYNASPAGMYMAVFANSLLMTVPMMLTGFIGRHLGENKGLIAFLVLWLSYEYSQYYGEISWPWLNFGHIFADSPKLIQWYEYSGILGGTCWILVINIFLYLIVRNVWIDKESFKVQTPNLIVFMGAIIFPVIFSIYTYYNYQEKNDPVEIVVVQPNIDPWGEKFDVPVDQQLNMMLSLSNQQLTDSTDLIVFPETAIPYGLLEDNIDNNKIITGLEGVLKKMNDTPLLLGASTNIIFDEPNSSASQPYGSKYYENYNSSLMVHPYVPLQVYHKAKAVLGGEKVPFIDWFPFLKKYSVELGGTSGVIGPGSEPIPFSASGIKVMPLICYESVYGQFVTQFTRNGADIICVITNDGWYDDTPGYKQHMVMSRLRAIENRRSVARSANTGISCFINQRGDVVKSLGWDERGVIRAKLNKNEELTFYVRFGDILGRVALFLAIGLFIYAITTMVRSRGIKTGE